MAGNGLKSHVKDPASYPHLGLEAVSNEEAVLNVQIPRGVRFLGGLFCLWLLGFDTFLPLLCVCE